MLYILRKSDTGTILAKTHSWTQVLEILNEVSNLQIDCIHDGKLKHPIIYDNFKKSRGNKKNNEDDVLPTYLLGSLGVICVIILTYLIVYSCI